MRRHVVAGFDGTAKGRAAVAKAIALAKDASCEVVIACTHERPATFDHAPFLLGHLDHRAWIREWEQETQEDLRHQVMRARLAGVDATAQCCLDDPADLLQELADKLDVECIVLPDDSEGPLHDLILGSVARRVQRNSSVPVVVLEAEE